MLSEKSKQEVSKLLDFDFKPVEEEVSPGEGDKRLKWSTVLIIALTLLAIAFAYLYVTTLQKYEQATQRVEELESITSQVVVPDSVKFEFTPEILQFKGVIVGPRIPTVIFEDKWGRNYVLPENSVVADWRVSIEGDTVMFESIKGSDRKIVFKGGE